MKKKNIRIANQEESYKFSGDNSIVYIVERKVKNQCGIEKKMFRYFGTIEELKNEFNILNSEEYEKMRTKTYQSNFK